MHRMLLTILIVANTVATRAQEKFTGYYEPYIQLDYDLTENYSHEFTIEDLAYWYHDKGFKVNVKQLDLAHFSSFKLKGNNAVSLGLQYRFEENFGGEEENELRFTEEYTYTTRPYATEFEHRVRAEQRIARSTTSYRFRYSFTITRSFKGAEIDTGEAFFVGNLETLLTVANAIDPEYEQRIGVGIGWALTNFVDLELVAEYRLDDFTRVLEHELFFVTGLNFNL